MDLRIVGLRSRFLPQNNEGADGITTNGWLVGTDWNEAISRQSEMLSQYLYFDTENIHEMSVRTVGPGCEI